MKIKNEMSIPISWMFLRSAACASGKMFIEYEEFRGLAEQCHISEDSFKDFLTTFTAMGSLIYIPEIEVFQKYIVLNPFDFFNKLNELFRPRFNGDLRYGIIKMPSLRRMFGTGEILTFFQCLLKSCHFAIPLEAKRIMYNETTEFISVEECFYVPTIRKQYHQRPCNIEHSLLLITDFELPPSLVIIEIIEDLLEHIQELKMLTSPYYNMTSFILKTMKFDLISHGNAIELRFGKKVIDEVENEFYTLVDGLHHAVSQRASCKICCFAIPCVHNVMREISYESKEAYHELRDHTSIQADKCKQECAKNQWICTEVCVEATCTCTLWRNLTKMYTH